MFSRRLATRGAGSLAAAVRPRAAALTLAPQRLLATKPPSTIQDDAHLFPDHVLEEEKTGFPVGLPQIKEAELWKEGSGDILVRARPAWAPIILPRPPRRAHRNRASSTQPPRLDAF